MYRKRTALDVLRDGVRQAYRKYADIRADEAVQAFLVSMPRANGEGEEMEKPTRKKRRRWKQKQKAQETSGKRKGGKKAR